MNSAELERIAIENIREEYEAKGFEVIVHPIAFRFGSYIPDLVLKKDNEVILVEIKTRKSPNIVRHLEKLKDEIESKTGHEFRIFYLESMRLPDGPKIQSNKQIQKTLKEVKSGLDNDELYSSFLLCWAAFEAAARRAFTETFRRPQSPGRLVTILAEEGLISPSQANKLRQLFQKRNALIHGHLDIDISKDEVREMVKCIQHIQSYSSPPQKNQ